MNPRNPFGEDQPQPQRTSPFEAEGGDLDPLNRIEHAARKVRRLRGQLGAEGLTLSATRELIDELAGALDATAKALRELRDR